jgi:hypothetical protein
MYLVEGKMTVDQGDFGGNIRLCTLRAFKGEKKVVECFARRTLKIAVLHKYVFFSGRPFNMIAGCNLGRECVICGFIYQEINSIEKYEDKKDGPQGNKYVFVDFHSRPILKSFLRKCKMS